MRRRKALAGKLIPLALAAGGIAAAVLTAMGLLAPFRPLMYIAAIIGVSMSFETFVRQGRRPVGEDPSLLLVTFVWFMLAVLALLAAILMLALETLYPFIPTPPYSMIVGLLGAACTAFLVLGVVLQIGSRRGVLADPTDPWILKPLFRRFSFRWLERIALSVRKKN